jgi:hypothetical protein
VKRLRTLLVPALAAIALAAGGGCGGDDPEPDLSGVEAPDYEQFLEDVESDPDTITLVTLPDEQTAIVQETTGASYELEVPEGDAGSLADKLEQAGIEVEAPKK